MTNRAVGQILKDYATGLWFFNVAEDGVVQCAYFKTEREANWFRMQVVSWNFKWTPDQTTSTIQGVLNEWTSTRGAPTLATGRVTYHIEQDGLVPGWKVSAKPYTSRENLEACKQRFGTYAAALKWVDGKRYPKTQDLKNIWDVAGDMLKAERRLAEYTVEHQVEDSRILAKAALECMWAHVLRKQEEESSHYTIEQISGPVATWKVLNRGSLVKYFDSYLEADAWINEQESFQHPHYNAQGIKINPPAPGEQPCGYKQV